MKNTITLLLFFSLTFPFYGQIQQNAPWSESSELKQKKKITLEDVSKAAETYFKTIDRDKKGSGLKPFKRWEYHWSHYLKPDGTIAPAKDLWNAWEQKKQLSKQNIKNNGDWKALGPFTSSNTSGLAPNFEQIGQGRINAIAVDPSNSNTYYIGSPAGGIWKSTDAGVNWTPLTDYLPQIGVSGIAIHPTDSKTIYIATGDDDANHSYAVGVWKSTDGGITWNNTGAIPGNPNSMNEIYFMPNASNTLLVATSTGVQKTTDAGTTWSTKLSGNILDIKMKPGDANTWYALTKDRFFKSTDGGDTFVEKNIPGITTDNLLTTDKDESNSSRMTMDVTAANSNYLYVISAATRSENRKFNGIYKSTDSGETFTKTNENNNIFESNQAWFDLAFTVSPTNADRLYVGVLNIWQSVNGGDNFFKTNNWDKYEKSYTHADIHFLRFFGNKLFAGTDGGIYMSEDNGVTYTDLTKNIAISQFYKISISQTKKDIIAGGTQDNGGFGYNSEKWYNYHGGDGMEGIISVNDYKKHYGFMQNGYYLFISDNISSNGTSSLISPSDERNVATGDTGGKWITPLVSDSKGSIYAGYSQVYKLDETNPSNRKWIKLSNHNFEGDIVGLEIDPNDDNTIYAFGRNSFGVSKIHKSTDAGVTFSIIAAFNESVNSIEVSNTDSDTVWLVTSQNVYKSTNAKNNAPTFTKILGNLPSEGKNIIKHHTRSGNNTVYLGTNLGVYYINDDITEWKTFDNKLPNTQIRDLEINEEEAILYAATFGRGIFSTPIPKKLPNNDVRLLSIDSPVSNKLNCEAGLAPEVTVKNQGKNEITAVTVKYSIDGGVESTYNWTGSIPSEATKKITIPTFNVASGNHSLAVETIITNDAYASNNKQSTTFLLNNFNSTPTTLNSFENSSDELLVETTSSAMWEIGSAGKTQLKVPSGSKAYFTKATGNYPDKTTGYLYTGCYDITQITNPNLKFKMAFDIEKDWDYMNVEYTTDNGKNWKILGTASDANWYNSSATTDSTNRSKLPGKQWTGAGTESNTLGGTNATAHQYSYDLSAFSTENSFIIRFVFKADDNTNGEGAVIDDLVIEGTLSSGDVTLLNNISISPNPSESIFNLKWKSEGETMNVGVFDITGKQVFSKKNIKDSNHRLDMSNYSSGIYLLKMQMNGKSATKKLILK
ncbi:Por secretion system C-terminal sorting domain-containing protein [Tenacibaculum sp. MAR_2010_89]|uniref:T9SS type A sorting domain-containing protein n=1 Tax=Tenacibaculum sp. MAR_2010_89 TaxID=1250198 RepID=UPI00089815C4|nr:T9SS type A sorting domain-containing protein [Tenacibaculum sp. MAR_2010_89]SEE19106.1 Por secretion system C-terminal sorting domain-containing protein [Tenacibaculum sp. MAR_2010_89]